MIESKLRKKLYINHNLPENVDFAAIPKFTSILLCTLLNSAAICSVCSETILFWSKVDCGLIIIDCGRMASNFSVDCETSDVISARLLAKSEFLVVVLLL